MRLVVSLALWLIAAPSSFATVGVEYVCKSANGKDERLIQVDYQSADATKKVPCAVQYVKKTEATEGSNTQTLWTAAAQAGYCEEKAQGLADKLAQHQWVCTLSSMATAPTSTPTTSPN